MGPTLARCLHFPPLLFRVSLQRCRLSGQAHAELLLLGAMSLQALSRTVAAAWSQTGSSLGLTALQLTVCA